MNTFHISPTHELADAVVDQVRAAHAKQPDVLMAVRGEFILTDEETGSGSFFFWVNTG